MSDANVKPPVAGRAASIKRSRLSALALPVVTAALLWTSGAQAQSYVNVTVGGVFAPGVYGQVAIGNNPPPPVINVQPIIYGQPVYGAPVMYLHVAPEEYRDWGRYCGRYRACGHPVQFVLVEQQNRWWEGRNEYLRDRNQYREPEYRHDNGRGHGRGRGHDRNDRGDERRDEHDGNRR